MRSTKPLASHPSRSPADKVSTIIFGSLFALLVIGWVLFITAA